MSTGGVPLYDQVGFNYVASIRELLTKMTYMELAFAIGYSSSGSISSLLRGRAPAHRHGEALWALYCDTFGKKPPLAVCAEKRDTVGGTTV
jgi:hypothetical protein